MVKFIVDVDTQVDFCVKRGNLYVPSAESILDNCEKLVNHAVRKKHLIIGSVDTHCYDSWEFNNNKNTGPNGEKPNFPPHCIKGTNGWLKMNDTSVKNSIFIPDTTISDETSWKKYLKHDVQGIYLEKEVYSLFANPNSFSFFHSLLSLPFTSIASLT
jgi:nicotinamidase/pyrazinamidase